MFEQEIGETIQRIARDVLQDRAMITLADIMEEKGIPDRFKSFYRAEAEWWVFNDTVTRSRDRRFDYAHPEIASLLTYLEGVQIRHARFERDDFLSVLDGAVKLTYNYLCRPQTTLKWYVFRGEPTKSLGETLLRIRAFDDYPYFATVFGEWVERKKGERSTFDSISAREFERIVRRIDDQILLSCTIDELLEIMEPLFTVIGRGDERGVPIDALVVFFDDKNIRKLVDFLESVRDRHPYVSAETFAHLMEDLLGVAEIEEEPEADFSAVYQDDALDDVVRRHLEETGAEIARPTLTYDESAEEREAWSEEAADDLDENGSAAAHALDEDDGVNVAPHGGELRAHIRLGDDASHVFTMDTDPEPIGPAATTIETIDASSRSGGESGGFSIPPGEEVADRGEDIDSFMNDERVDDERVNNGSVVDERVNDGSVADGKPAHDSFMIDESGADDAGTVGEESEAHHVAAAEEVDRIDAPPAGESIEEWRITEEAYPDDAGEMLEISDDEEDEYEEYHPEEEGEGGAGTNFMSEMPTGIEASEVDDEADDADDEENDENESAPISRSPESGAPVAPPTAADEPDGDPHHLENVRAQIDAMLERKVVKKIFNKDRAEYERTLDLLNDTDSWKDASRLLEELFARNAVDPYSRTAIRFTDAVYGRFLQFKIQS